MGRDDPEFDTGRQRRSMFPVEELIKPVTIAEQLAREGATHSDPPQGNQGQILDRPCYPLAGDAGFDTDHDADDYNTAAHQTQPQTTTSSSGPP
jgi:hypothetical protein